MPVINLARVGARVAQISTGQGGQEGQDQPTTTMEQKLTFGGPLFSLSGGLVISRIKKQEFGPVTGVVRDREGNPTMGDQLTSVIGLKENTDFTVGPLLLLHTRLLEIPAIGLHGSVGITGKRDDKGTDIDYFFGPSINLLSKRVFISAGAYVGKQQVLAGDAFLGAPVASDATVPVRKEYHVKFGISFTYRIYSFK